MGILGYALYARRDQSISGSASISLHDNLTCITMVLHSQEVRRYLMQTISFRFDAEVKKELDYIKSHINSSQSQAIKDAIHAYYRHLQEQEEEKKSPQQLLKESGYIGSFKGRKNLSTTYKNDITNYLKTKHGIKE